MSLLEQIRLLIDSSHVHFYLREMEDMRYCVMMYVILMEV